MAEPTVCDKCSSPISPDDTTCQVCGSAIAGRGTEGTVLGGATENEDPEIEDAETGDATEPVHVPDGWPIDIGTLQRQSAREAAAKAAAAGAEAARRAAAEAAAEKRSAWRSDLASRAEVEAPAEPEPVAQSPVWAARPSNTDAPSPGPQQELPQAEPAAYLAPSATYRSLSSIGGRQAAPLGPPEPGPRPSSPPLPTPLVAPPAYGASAATPLAMSAAARAATRPAGPTYPAGRVMRPAPPPPAVPLTAWERFAAKLASISSQPKSQLVAAGLVVLGGAMGTVSFFLPWAGPDGMAIGAMGSNPTHNAWAFDTPAGWPLFIITVLLVASVLVSDQLEDLMPGLAATVRRLTEVVSPMLLGGVYAGVAVVNWTLPWASGSGISMLALASGLLIAGSITGLFYPAGQRGA